MYLRLLPLMLLVVQKKTFHHLCYSWTIGTLNKYQRSPKCLTLISYFNLQSKQRNSNLSSSTISSEKENYILSAQKNHDNTEELYKELKEISRKLRENDELYYNINSLHEPKLSDSEYDSLAKREEEICLENPSLKLELEREFGLENATRATRVGISSSIGNDKIQHLEERPMLSLENAFEEESVLKWINKTSKKLNETQIEFLAEPKLDGLSLSLRYRLQDNNNYTLVSAATRGDGKCGEDVTNFINEVSSDSKTIPTQFLLQNKASPPSLIEVRGECILSLSALQTYLQDRELHLNSINTTTSSNSSLALQYPLFANARNAASGVLRRFRYISPPLQILRNSLLFYAYDIVPSSRDDLFEESKEMRHFLSNIGFKIPEPHAYSSNTSDLFEYYQQLLKKRSNSNIEMDGVVLKLSSIKHRVKLGTSNTFPKWALAYKFPHSTTYTRIKNVLHQVGRTGVITPVAELEPVMLNNVKIQRVTLHQYDFVKKITSRKVEIARAGDVIPQVIQSLSSDDDEKEEEFIIQAPEFCPACHSPTEFCQHTKEIGKILYCSGSQYTCPPRAIGSMSHTFSKQALNVVGLSYKKIEQLYHEELIQYPSDFFSLNETKVLNLTKWGPKSFQNLQQSLSHIKVSLATFIYSLGIRNIGSHVSNIIASCYISQDKFFKAMDDATSTSEEEAFKSLKHELGVGSVIISSLHTFANDAVALKEAKKLAHYLTIDDMPKLEKEAINADLTSKPWNNQVVVFTGSIPGYTRAQCKDIAKNILGARQISSSISSKTNIVILGNKAGSKKLTQIEEVGGNIQVLQLHEFLSLLNEYNVTSNDSD